MVSMVDFKGRLLGFLSSAVNWVIRDRAVAEPRFTLEGILSKRTGGTDWECFGALYSDNISGKEYLVDEDFYEKNNKNYHVVKTMWEIVGRPKNTMTLDESTFRREVIRKDVDVDVYGDLISFLQNVAVEDNGIFEDRTRRPIGIKGNKLPVNPAHVIA